MDTSNPHYITKVGKILSRQKYPDRTSLATVHKPQDPLERASGILYFVIEIINTDPAMRDIAKLIVDTTIDAYYKEPVEDPLSKFEAALKKVNEKLASLAEEGEVGWVGKTNAIIAVLAGNNLHLSQAGTAEAYLIRNSKIIHISEGLSSSAERPHPLKTFLNIASGELFIGDKILISTAELFYHFSQDDLRRIITKYSPAIASTYIVKVLRKEDVESISTLILELTTEEILSEEILVEEPENIWLQEQKNSWQQIKETAKPVLEKLKILSKSATAAAQKSYKEKIGPEISRITSSAKNKFSHSLKKIQNEAKERGVYEKAEKYLKETEEKISEFWNETKKPRTRSRLYIVLAIIFLLIIIFTIVNARQKQNVKLAREEIKQIYIEARDKESAAKTALIYQDIPKAKNLIEEAMTLADKIKDSTYLHDDILNLLASLQSQKDRVTNTFRLENLSPIADFSTLDKKISTQGIFALASTLFTFDRQKNKIYSFDLVASKPDVFVQVADPGIFVDGAIPIDTKTIVYNTKGPVGVIELDTENKSTSAARITFGGDFTEAEALASYFNNIYLLDTHNNQIIKHSKTIEGYSKATPYLTQSQDLSLAIDLAVDGNVWVLTSDGKILKFLAGAKQEFSLSGIPAPATNLSSPKTLYTDVLTTYLYILDNGNKRILEIDKNGNYSRQFVADFLADASSIFIDAGTKKLYALSGTKVYKIDL